MAVRADGPGSAALVRLMAVESGRSVPRAAKPGRPDMAVTLASAPELTSPFGGRSGTMRQLHFDLLRLLKDDRQGSHGSRRAQRYVLAQAAETLHQLGYRGLRAKGLKGRHIEALVAEWRRQGLSDGTVKNRMAHLRWLAKKIGKPGIVRRDNASYGVGARCAT